MNELPIIILEMLVSQCELCGKDNKQLVPRNFFCVHIHSDPGSLLFVFVMPVQSSKYITSASSPGQGSSRRKIFNVKSMELHQSYARKRATF